jgi:hypothetical protein
MRGKKVQVEFSCGGSITDDGHEPIDEVGEDPDPDDAHEERHGVPTTPFVFPTIRDGDAVQSIDRPTQEPFHPGFTTLT